MRQYLIYWRFSFARKCRPFSDQINKVQIYNVVVIKKKMQ